MFDNPEDNVALHAMVQEYRNHGRRFIPKDEFTLSEDDARVLQNLLHAWREGSVMIMTSAATPRTVNASSDEIEWHVDHDVANKAWRVVCDGTIVGTIKNVTSDQIDDLRHRLQRALP